MNSRLQFVVCGRDVLSAGECGRRLDVVPVLAGEGVNPLLQALLAFRQTLILANSHDCAVAIMSGCGRSRFVEDEGEDEL